MKRPPSGTLTEASFPAFIPGGSCTPWVSRVGPGAVQSAAPGRRGVGVRPPAGVSLTRRDITSIGSFVSLGPSCAAGANVPPRARWMAAVASSRRPCCVRRVASAMPVCIWSFMIVLLSMSGRLDPAPQRRLHGRARPESAEHDQGVNGLQGQLRIYVIVNARQAEHSYLQRLSSLTYRLQVAAGVVLQPEHQRLARHRLPDLLGVRGELVADGRSDEVSAIGVETLLHQQIYLPQIHKPQIDRDLLRLTHAGASLVTHLCNIHIPSIWMLPQEPGSVSS